MHVPVGSLLAVENFSLELVALLLDLVLRLGLHYYELPLAREELLQTSQIFGLVVGQLQTCLVLHRSLAQVHGYRGFIKKMTIRFFNAF